MSARWSEDRERRLGVWWRRYGERGDASFARREGLTLAAVRRKRERLGMTDRRPWERREERYLQRRWELWEGPAMEFDVRAAEILNRTIGSVKARRQKLGLVKEQK